MKRTVALLLSLLLTVSLCACAGKPAAEPPESASAPEGTESAPAETAAPTEEPIRVNCIFFSVLLPPEWNGRFGYTSEKSEHRFYYSENGEIEEDLFLFSVSLTDPPQPEDGPAGLGGIGDYYIAGTLSGGGANGCVAVNVTDPDEAFRKEFVPEAKEMLSSLGNITERIVAGSNAFVFTPADYSALEGSVWYAMLDWGGGYKLTVEDTRRNLLEGRITFSTEDGAWDFADFSVFMYPDWGVLQWEQFDDYTGEPAASGGGRLTPNGEQMLLSLTGPGDSWTTTDGDIALHRVYVPDEAEIGAVSGTLTERCDRFEVSLPDCWKGLYTCVKTADSLAFYHTASRDSYGGFLFSFGAHAPEAEEYYDFAVPVRKLIEGDTVLYISCGRPGDMQADLEFTEQYNAMEAGLHAVLGSLRPVSADARIEKFDLGFRSERYAGQNENGDVYELLLEYESIVSASGTIFRTSAEGGASQRADVQFYKEDGDFRCNVFRYNDAADPDFSADGIAEFNGDTLTLDLRVTDGAEASGFAGRIVLTAQRAE